MARDDYLVSPGDLNLSGKTIIIDCRFELADPAAGRRAWSEGHIPGAHYVHLEEDLSAAAGRHGGRHPLPDPIAFVARLASLGIGLDTPVVAYDNSRFAFASRLWWMMKSLGYREVRLLDGGWSGWVAHGGVPCVEVPRSRPLEAPRVGAFQSVCDIDGLRRMQAAGAALVDSREPRRYEGLEEPIDPVAGHIPGAVNRPWQDATDNRGSARDAGSQAARWRDLEPDLPVVVYCGSGVTACVNLLSLAIAGREDAILYAGSWSDWCSYL
jgi:thiosulfate/3-mercaptopyruvate sulfurtransferase